VPATEGELVLTYPKWIPGEHSPTGPVQQLVGLRFSAGGKPIAWRRDAVDMFAFHLAVPAGGEAIEADFDYLSPQDSFGGGYGEGPNATAHWLVVLWNLQLLVPRGTPSDAAVFRPSLVLPSGWNFDSALDVAARSADAVEFAPVSLTVLVDSPVLAGEHFRSFPVAAGDGPVRLSVAADDPADLAVPEARLHQLRQVVAEAQALFGARHYRRYAWLVTLTDALDPNGLEHPESSDNRLPAHVFSDDRLGLAELRILPHEYVHSWNGKHRRPGGLATPDYERPMDGSLLWIYEGLTRYLGDVVLATRAGIRPAAATRDYLAWMASQLEDSRPGRRWREFVADRVERVQAPLGGLAAAGWKLVYGSEPNVFMAGRQASRHQIDWGASLGIRTNDEGELLEVIQDSPAFAAGLVAGEKIVGVDSAKWSAEALARSLGEAFAAGRPLELLVDRRGELSTARLTPARGAVYPHLERVAGTADRLSEILTARAAP
jgi:predicted metalloprotease with PDZ domain